MTSAATPPPFFATRAEAPEEPGLATAAARFAVVFGATLAAVSVAVGLIALAAPVAVQSLLGWASAML